MTELLAQRERAVLRPAKRLVALRQLAPQPDNLPCPVGEPLLLPLRRALQPLQPPLRQLCRLVRAALAGLGARARRVCLRQLGPERADGTLELGSRASSDVPGDRRGPSLD